MKVVFHEDFYQVYTQDPAAAAGRMEAVVRELEGHVEFVSAEPAMEEDIAGVHSGMHVESVKRKGLYDISSLAAGGAVMAAEIGLREPCFALIRPPGHHASANSCWGFCYFNNMAVAIHALRRKGKISSAFVLDIDLHFGDGNVNILDGKKNVVVYNPEDSDSSAYLEKVEQVLGDRTENIIGISAGFDNHVDDWGGLLTTEDYREIGRLVRAACRRSNAGCFAILEGGYNHEVLGKNVLALIQGLESA